MAFDSGPALSPMDRNIEHLGILVKSQRLDSKKLAQGIGAAATELEAAKVTRDVRGNQHLRFNQSVDGVPVWGAQVVVHELEGRAHSLSGSALELSVKPAQVDPKIEANQAEVLALRHASELSSKPQIEDLKSELIYYPVEDQLVLVWLISFYYTVTAGETHVHQWNYFIDANSGQVLSRYDGLLTVVVQGSGPGGNAKFANSWNDFLDLEFDGNTHKMDTPRLRTTDMNNATGNGLGTIIEGAQNNACDAAECDAHGYAEVFLNLLEDVYGLNSFDGNGGRVTSRVHYGQNFANAFWNPALAMMTYGDGGGTFYPLSQDLSVVAHEIGHGTTSNHSNLAYRNESGGMNESFSDIMGTVAEFYHFGDKANFLIGENIMRNRAALRFMCDPPRDGRSIGHFDDYQNGMDVHFSSGVGNKAFCLAVRRFSSGGNPNADPTRDAVIEVGKIFLEANRNQWTPNSSYVQSAQGTLNEAQTLNLSRDKQIWLIQSWADVGVSLTDWGVSVADGHVLITPGEEMTVAVSVQNSALAAGPINLSLSGVPQGLEASFSETPTIAGSVELRLKADAGLARGSYNMSVAADDGSQPTGTSFQLHVVSKIESGKEERVETENDIHRFKVSVPERTRYVRVEATEINGEDIDFNISKEFSPQIADPNAECLKQEIGKGECLISDPEPGDRLVSITSSRGSAVDIRLKVTVLSLALYEIDLDREIVLAGEPVTGVLTLTSAIREGEDGTVTLTSDNPAVSVPSQVVFGKDESIKDIEFDTDQIDGIVDVTLTATLGDQVVTRTVTLEAEKGAAKKAEQAAKAEAEAAGEGGGCAAVHQPVHPSQLLSWLMALIFWLPVYGNRMGAGFRDFINKFK